MQSLSDRRPARLVLLCAALVVAQACQRNEPHADLDAIRAKLEQRFPEVPVRAIHTSSTLPGLLEVVTDTTVAYVDATGDHLFVGRVMHTETKRDLSSEAWDRYNAIDIASLPLDRAIKTVRGDGSRFLAVFSDPDCPYCKQLENELEEIENATIYTFLFPVETNHPGAVERAKRIWCADNPNAAWRDWMLFGREPGSAVCADSPVDDNVALGQHLRISSTPTLFFANGSRLSRNAAAKELERVLSIAKPTS